MCKICGDNRCLGKYLLHERELFKVSDIEREELKVNPKRDFKLVRSPSSGEIFTKFYELHVLDIS
jgi:hypothetical protein